MPDRKTLQTHRPRLVRTALWPTVFCGLIPAVAAAQPVERHLPQTPDRPHAEIVEPALPSTISDDRSLGAPLRALILLGPADAPFRDSEAKGLNCKAVARLNTIHEQKFLEPFLGQTISRRLISQIETQIVKRYRASGYPFVQVSTPEQEITRGVLQIRVVEFRLGAAKIAGGKPWVQHHVKAAIRTHIGDTISGDRLSEDLDWLNRDPRRVIATTFTPGGKLGESDLTLTITANRPWGVNASYANSGSPQTGQARYSVGADVYVHILADEALSAQATGSPDFWVADGKPFHNSAPRYASAAGHLQIFTAPRQLLDLTINAVETNAPVQAFIIRQRTIEATAAYRSALSNIVPLAGEIGAGLEMSHQARQTFFDGVSVVQTAQNVYQLFGDWSDRWADGLGSTGVDLNLHYSPGGIDGLNTGQALATFTNGRVQRSRYVYGQASVSHQTALLWAMTLQTQINGQYVGRAVPDSQQIALGGQNAVRGYSLDDGAWDDGAIVRNDLKGKELRLGQTGGITPRVFVDYGWGRSYAAHLSVQQISGGLGSDVRLGNGLGAGVNLAVPIKSGKETRSGVARFEAKVSVAY